MEPKVVAQPPTTIVHPVDPEPPTPILVPTDYNPMDTVAGLPPNNMNPAGLQNLPNGITELQGTAPTQPITGQEPPMNVNVSPNGSYPPVTIEVQSATGAGLPAAEIFEGPLQNPIVEPLNSELAGSAALSPSELLTKVNEPVATGATLPVEKPVAVAEPPAPMATFMPNEVEIAALVRKMAMDLMKQKMAAAGLDQPTSDQVVVGKYV